MIFLRSFVAAAGLALGLASAASAATVASFQGTALASLTLVSAVFTNGGQDAGQHLYWIYADDEDGTAAEGDARADFDYCADFSSCLSNEGEIVGTATPGTPASARSYGYLDFLLYYESCAACTGSLTLSFDYSVGITGSTSLSGGLGSASLEGDAYIRATEFGRVSVSSTNPQTLSGSFSLVLDPEDSIYLGSSYRLEGSASVMDANPPAPVPLPATLPMLLAAGAGLGLWSRRRI